MFLSRLVQRIHFNSHKGLLSNSLVSCRKCSDKPSTDLKKATLANEEYVTVYKFPMIRHIAAYSRLKIYHAACTLMTIPTTYILASQGLVDPDMPIAATYLGISIGIFLFGTGISLNRFVGFIYFNEEKNMVKVAYVDYWGNRKEKELPISDVIPLSELPVGYISHYLYKPFSFYSGSKTLKMSLNQGVIVDQEKYDKIFLEMK